MENCFFSDFKLYFPLYNSLAATSKAINISFPILYGVFSIASNINSMASSFDLKSGANPPSSPTVVA